MIRKIGKLFGVVHPRQLVVGVVGFVRSSADLLGRVLSGGRVLDKLDAATGQDQHGVVLHGNFDGGGLVVVVAIVVGAQVARVLEVAVTDVTVNLEVVVGGAGGVF